MVAMRERSQETLALGKILRSRKPLTSPQSRPGPIHPEKI